MARKTKPQPATRGRPPTVGTAKEPSVVRTIRLPADYDRELVAEAKAAGMTPTAMLRYYLGIE